MTTFTTTVAEMFTLPQEAGQADVVVNVVYLVAGVEGEYAANISFSQQFTIQQGDAFTPYAQLTEAQVVGWADPQTIASFEDCVQGHIDSLAHPPITPSLQPLPWA